MGLDGDLQSLHILPRPWIPTTRKIQLFSRFIDECHTIYDKRYINNIVNYKCLWDTKRIGIWVKCLSLCTSPLPIFTNRGEEVDSHGPFLTISTIFAGTALSRVGLSGNDDDLTILVVEGYEPRRLPTCLRTLCFSRCRQFWGYPWVLPMSCSQTIRLSTHV